MDYNASYSIKKLSKYVGDSETQIREMVKLFIDSIPPDVLKLVEFSACGDFENSYKTAHRIKPSFDVFAIDDIFNELKLIESIAIETTDHLLLTNKVSSLQLKVNAIIEKMKRDFHFE